MGMKCQKIHAHPNDWIMYRHEFEEMHKGPRCGVLRSKVKDDDKCSSDENSKKGLQLKVLWYLLIIPRFKRLFVNRDNAKKTLHGMQMGETMMECSAIRLISLSGRRIDRLDLDFGKVARNLRLELATDEMNPFGNLSTNHSSWPILLVIYNLPPWLRMK